MGDFKTELRDYCSGIGIDLFGVTTVEPFERFLSELKQREADYRPRYDYRLDTWYKMGHPEKVLNGAKSVIVIGYNYFTNDTPPSEAHGNVARIVTYGHLGILTRVRSVVKYLKKRGYDAVPGAHRKEAAVRAGLGMVGKHNLVINPTYGAWVAYQTIVTNADLEPDAPFTTDLCQDCDECLKACPTQAIYEPRRLNPKKCIPYLLTDKPTGEEHWPKLDHWILGCDICLSNCPFGRDGIEKDGQDSFFPGGMGTYPLLKMFLTITDAQFQNEIMAHVNKKVGTSKAVGMIMELPGGPKLMTWMATRFLKGKEKIPDTLVHASSSLTVYRRNAIVAAANKEHKELKPLIEKWKDDDALKAVVEWALTKLES